MTKVSARPSAEAVRKLFQGPCTFVFGTTDAGSMPPARLPEVAFAGRSNAGKSSLINALLSRRGLARTSRTPGRTQQINFFDLGGSLMIADLPGYGFASASKALVSAWQHLIHAYLLSRPNLRRVLVLIDARRGVMDADRHFMRLLDEAAVSFAPVLTKIDKIHPSETKDVICEVEGEARRHATAYPEIVATSAMAGTGLEPLRRQIALLTR